MVAYHNMRPSIPPGTAGLNESHRSLLVGFFITKGFLSVASNAVRCIECAAEGGGTLVFVGNKRGCEHVRCGC